MRARTYARGLDGDLMSVNESSFQYVVSVKFVQIILFSDKLISDMT